MMDTFDKIKKQALNAKDNIVKNLKSMNIKPCDGAEFEYVSNDEDYNEFLKNEGFETRDYINFSGNEGSEDKETESVPKEEKNNTFDNISDMISEKINQFKRVMDDYSDKKSYPKESFEQLQNSVSAFDTELTKVVTALEQLKTSTDALAKETKAASAASSFTLEKTMSDIVDLNNKVNAINTSLNELNEKIISNSDDYTSIKNELIGLKSSANSINADISEISAAQQMLKNSVLSMASSIDALNKKLTTGFVTVGIIGAVCAVMLIVFNLL